MSDQIADPTETRSASAPNPLSDGLAVALQSKFEEWKAARVLYEQEWLKDLRQYLGVYDPELKKRLDPNRSQANIRNTRWGAYQAVTEYMDWAVPVASKKVDANQYRAIQTVTSLDVTRMKSEVFDLLKVS